MPESKRLRQLIDVSSERPNDRDIFVYDKAEGKWTPMRGDFDEMYYPRDEADAAFAPAVHDHDDRYYTKSQSDVHYAPAIHNHDSAYAPLNHNHDSRYYTRAQSDSQYAPTSHNHDDRYYQQSAAEIEHSRLRSTATALPTLTGTTHAVQAGPSNNWHLKMGGYRIQAVSSANAAMNLHLNPHGGQVYAGGTTGNDIVATASDLNGKADSNHNHDSRYYQQNTAEIEHSRFRSTQNTNATLTSTLHGFQTGTDTSTNLALGNTRIQARNNGNASILYLNPNGGTVRAGGTAASSNVITSGDGPLLSGDVYSPTKHARSTDATRSLSGYVTLMTGPTVQGAGSVYIITFSADVDFNSNGTLGAFRLSGGPLPSDPMPDELIVGGDSSDRSVFSKTWIVATSGTSGSIRIDWAAFNGSLTVRHTHTTLYAVKMTGS